MNKTKFIVGFLVLVLLAVPAYMYKKSYTGTNYYTQINTEPQKTDAIDDSGVRQGSEYIYSLVGYDEKGTKATLDFSVFREVPLKENAFLKVEQHENKGVLRWEEVQIADIPSEALRHLK